MKDKRTIYNEFHSVFPLESLNGMTLEQYTNLEKKDSFCYWLEAKTYELGSFWGGSSYKFGIYQYNKKPNDNDPRIKSDNKYAWYEKYHKDTADEAFGLVKDTIVKIANYANEGKFEEIDKIDLLGHSYKWKIAFLYSNEQLIPIFKKELLERIASHYGLGNPKSKSYVELQMLIMSKRGDKDLFDFYEELLPILDKREPKIWLYAPGTNADKWNRCLEENIMCIGWDEMGDLSLYNDREEIREALQKVYDKPDANFMNDSLALIDFLQTIQVGDIIYAKKGTGTIIGRGIVEGDYSYDDLHDDFRSVRKVTWTHVGEWHYAKNNLVQKTLTDISTYKELVKDLDCLVNAKSETKRYWWLVANPKIWSMQSLAVGATVEYLLYNDNNKPRRIFQNFMDARVGDVIVGYEATPQKQIVALGKVSKEQNGKTIEFTKTETLKNPIDLSYLKEIEDLKEMQFFKNPQGSFFKLTEDEYDTLLDIIRETNAMPVETKPESYTKEKFLEEVFMSASSYDKLKKLLERKKNIILQGAPGVGKTFAAKRLAYSMMGIKDDDRVEMVQFHQNFSYEDFIMGYKPTEDGGFKLHPGIFYDFCIKAKNNPDKDYFFIIDEINRGNLSKILGELMMLIENEYRGTSIKLAYTNEYFTVPENVYIIGMMNTADRSLAMIDYALRRRFSFYEMEPGFESEGFKSYQKNINNEMFDNVIAGIISLNETIKKDDSLGSGFCIGHSYFCGQKGFDKEWLENVINYDIVPMLKEYWFDDTDKCQLEINKLTKLL